MEQDEQWDLLKEYIGQNGHTGYFMYYSTADEEEFGRLQRTHDTEKELILKVDRDEHHFVSSVANLKTFRCFRTTKTQMNGNTSQIRKDERACFCEGCREGGTGCYHPEITGQGNIQDMYKVVERSFKCESTEKKVPKAVAAGEQVAPVEGPAAPAPPPVALDAPAAALRNDNDDSNVPTKKNRCLVEIRVVDGNRECTSSVAGIIKLGNNKLVGRVVVCTLERGGWFLGVVKSQTDEHVAVRRLNRGENMDENVSFDRVKWCYNEKPTGSIVTHVSLPDEARLFFNAEYNHVE